MARLPEAPEHAVPAWVGRTAENNRKNNANGQARNEKRPVRLFLSVFTKRASGLRQGMTVRHVSARWIHTVKTQSKNTNRNKKIKYSQKGCKWRPFRPYPTKRSDPAEAPLAGNENSPARAARRGLPGAWRSAAGGCCSLRRASIWCILYSVLVWAAAGTRGCPARPEPEAAKAWRTRETIPEGRLV